MDWLVQATQRQYGGRKRFAALIFGQVLFLLVYPAFIVLGAGLLDGSLDLPKFAHGSLNSVVAIALIGPGLVLVEWTIGLQFAHGLGTPLPVVATRRLINTGPYRHSRNPMAAGTTMVYLGIALWLGSWSAIALASIYPIGIIIYTKLVEEKELERRFGSRYVEYKRNTPFLLPRFPRRNSAAVHVSCHGGPSDFTIPNNGP
jgi:protein-S-isoprenylcysteine O-methyltransferase Ste14